MSVAYRSSTAVDYRRVNREEAAQPQKKAVPRTKPVMAQRAALFLAALLAAAACIGLLYMKAQVSMAQRSINEINAQIAAADRLNSKLSAQYAEATNINDIMNRAAALGMSYPDNNSVLYVSLADEGGRVDIKNPR